MAPIDTLLNYPAPILCWALPLLGALLSPLFAKISGKLRDYMAVAFSFSAVVSAVSMIPWLLSGKYPGDVAITTWIRFPGLAEPLEVGVLVDPLSIIVANVVAFISFLIVVYSLGYMRGDPGLTRYWFFFQFFIGSMLLLVLSDNFIQLLIGWEGVGLCSYGLIGYYYRDTKDKWVGGPEPTPMFSPSHSAMKAFVVTGVGDVLLLAAIFIVYTYAGTFNFVELIENKTGWIQAMGAVPGLISLTSLLILGGPIGKSAQFPFHEWLPEAMTGPTSVSALIHAATMVKAGVYLVARLSPIFYLGSWVYNLGEAKTFFIAIAIVGGFTTFLAASQALVSVELKKVLAYSTVSQIGYMMLGLGVSGLASGVYVAGLTSGIYHLVSHALFKAALFLGAGSVIHTIESIYMFNMGGLKKYMPITYILMLIAALTLSGVPPFVGFWSKDAVFVAAYSASTPLSLVLLVVAGASAALTFLYSLRFISLTFFGHESAFIKEEEHEGRHIHEAPSVMWMPYAILVFIAVILGVLGLIGLFNASFSPEVFIEGQMDGMLEHMGVPLLTEEVKFSATLMVWGMSAAMLSLGGLLGWIFYLTHRIDSWTLVSGSGLLRGIHTFLWNRWYMNPTYYKIFVNGTLGLANGTFRTFETKVIDGGLNVGIPRVIVGVYNQVRKIQTGVLSYNLLYIMLTLLVLIAVFLLGGV
jgi:NADH-quinone oxidoreductase subunit L